jgi:hypothetical protein
MTLAEIRLLMQLHLTELLGVQAAKVRPAYETSAVGREVYDDVCYFYVLPADNPINRQIDKTYQDEGGTARVVNRYTRVIELSLTFYGPSGYDKAVLLRMDLLEPDLNERLFAAGLRVVTDIAEPFCLWENYREQWIMRTDMSVRFNQAVTDARHEAEYLQGARVLVETENDERTVDI